MSSDHKPDALFLIGPKGSGKTFVGVVLERELGIPFLRVEPIWLAIKAAEPDLSGADYMERGKQAVIEAAEALAARSPAFALETTGAMDGTAAFIARFAAFSRPRLIAIRAARETCVRRVRERDRTDHIPVSDHLVEQVHARSVALELPYERVIDNDPCAAVADIVGAIRSLTADSADEVGRRT